MNLLKKSLIAPTLAILLCSNLYAQDIYTMESMPLKKAISEITEDMNLPYVIDSKLIEGKRTKQIENIKGAKKALNKILLDADLEAEIKDDLIIIREKRDINTSSNNNLGQYEVVGNLNNNTEGSGSYTIGAMSSATKMNLSSLETPQSISVMTSEKMKNFSLDSINDVLLYSPGITVEKVETDRTKYTSRGFDITNFQVDGLNLPINYGITNGTIDTAIFDHVQIIKGATGLMSGAGDPSATVNMIRKRPTKETQASVSMEVGSWDKKRIVADVSVSLSEKEDVRARMVLVHENSKSYLDRYEKEQNLFYGIIEKDINDNTKITAGFSYEKDKPNSPLWGALPLYYLDGTDTNYVTSTSSSPDWAFRDLVTKNVFAELAHNLDNEWEFKSVLNYVNSSQHSNLLLSSGYPNSVSDPSVAAITQDYTEEESEKFIDLYLKGPYEVAGFENEAVLGFSWAKKHTTQNSLYDNTTGNGKPTIPNLSTWNGSLTKPTFADGQKGGDFSTEQLAIYAATNFHLTEDLKVLAGTRLSNWETTGESYGRDYTSTDKNVFTPYLGLVYNINDTTSTYASYTTSFVPQEKVDKDKTQIDPTESVNYELGLKKEFFDGNVQSSFAIFKTVQDNATEKDGKFSDGKDYYKTIDGIISKGYELEIYGKVSDGLNVSLGYTNFNVKDNEDKDTKTYIPRQLIKLSSTYQLQSVPALKVGASINWQDDIYVNQKAATIGPNTGKMIVTKQDAYAIINLMSEYKINKNLTATVNLNNVSDEKYINSLSWGRGYYGAPRSAYLTLEWKL